MMGLVLFAVLFVIFMLGYPVGLALGGVSVLFGYFFIPDFLDFLPLRVMGVMENQVLMSIPMFIWMGLLLEKSGIAEKLLESMTFLFGSLPGGLALSIIMVGTLLAASTGIVGATVVTMGLISLPSMIRRNYDIPVATGVIAASGTLGQIIPPSVVLVILGSVMNVSVGALFTSAIVPGLILVSFYILYVFTYARIFPHKAPALSPDEIKAFKTEGYQIRLFYAIGVPILLMLLVLGSIFLGIASPTEASALGALGALGIGLSSGSLSWTSIKESLQKAVHITSMVFLILLGATTFALVFRGLGGEAVMVEWIQKTQLTGTKFLILVMIVVFIAGFFIDFIEIVFIFVPVILPVLIALKVDLVWVGILLAVNLQTSFLTPPFGFALFYLKGVAPEEVRSIDIYKGVIPFLLMQLLVLVLIWMFPEMIYLIKNH